MDAISRLCMFCQIPLSENREKEHVVPVWLLEYLDIGEEKISPTHFRATDHEAESTRRHPLNQLREGRVCGSCNSIWMSNLEGEVKDLLVSLMEHRRDVTSLSDSERLILARWSLKTAGVLNSSSNFTNMVPADHMTHLFQFRDSLPQDVIVVAGQHTHSQKFNWIQSSSCAALYKKEDGLTQEDIKALSSSSYKIGLQFGALLLTVAYWPHPGWQYGAWIGVHKVTWPLSGTVSWLKMNKPFPDHNSEKALPAFYAALSVVKV